MMIQPFIPRPFVDIGFGYKPVIPDAIIGNDGKFLFFPDLQKFPRQCELQIFTEICEHIDLGAAGKITA